MTTLNVYKGGGAIALDNTNIQTELRNNNQSQSTPGLPHAPVGPGDMYTVYRLERV